MKLIYETVHGSTAYGLNRKGSDVDLKGLIIGPPAWYMGFATADEQVVLHDDHVRFELRKFFRLAVDCNPNVIEMLWTRPEHHRVMTPLGRQLLEGRERFLSRRAEGSFGRYALGQLKRIKTHRQWLLHPPARKPQRSDFGLPDNHTLSKDLFGAADTLEERGIGLDDGLLDVLDRERRYRGAMQHYKQYLGWKTSRNPKRAALEAEFGYDTKHAMHLVRLLSMGIEILQGKGVQVWRDDRELLWSIRDGAWSYDELVDRAEALSKDLRQAAESSTLPHRADRDALNAWCTALVREGLDGA